MQKRRNYIWLNSQYGVNLVLLFLFLAISMRSGEEEMQTSGLGASLGNAIHPDRDHFLGSRIHSVLALLRSNPRLGLGLDFNLDIPMWAYTTQLSVITVVTSGTCVPPQETPLLGE